MGLEKLTDDNLSSLLCNPENIPLLERIALRELKKYHELQDRIPGYNPLTHDTDITPNKKELQALFEETKKDVHQFLEIQNASKCIVKHNGIITRDKALIWTARTLLGGGLAYVGSAALMIARVIDIDSVLYATAIGSATAAAWSFKRVKDEIPNQSAYQTRLITGTGYIALPKRGEIPTKAILDHEYTHHIQEDHGFKDTRHTIFTEGHARSVERNIAKIRVEKTGNTSHENMITHYTANEMLRAYSWVCHKNGVKPSMNLGYDESLIFPHEIGHPLLYLWEEKYGPEIHTKLLRGETDIISELR